MENNVIIAAVIGLLIGAIIVFFLKPKTKVNPRVKNVDFINEDINALKSNVSVLEKEKTALQQKLSENEELLKIIQQSDNKGNKSKSSPDFDKLLQEIKKLKHNIEELEKDLVIQEENIKKLNTHKEDLENVLESQEKNNKKLKDDIEDLEDDLEDQRKNNKKIKGEKEEIAEELEKLTKDKTSLSEEKEKLTTEVKVLEQKREEDNNSLQFINNILNAHNASTKDFEKLVSDTLHIYSFIGDRISHYFENPEDINNSAWQWRNIELKTWIKSKKVVAIVGEFSAGKTSIVNRILSQDDPTAPLLPVSSKETTAIPTYISNGKDFNCQFYSPDNELRNITKETFEMVTKSALDKVNVAHLIKYFVLSYNNEHLNNISILDTPGFGSNSEDIIKRTTDVVKEAHALFWVIDANTGDINQTSIDVMRKHLNELPLYFIINKSDTKSEGDLDKLEGKVKETARRNEISFKAVIRFSQKENIDVLMKHISEIEIKEQPPLMKEVAETLNKITKKLNDEKKDLNNARKENSKNLTETENNFKTIQGDISFSAEKIKKLVKPKDNFFTGLKYQIDKLDYDDFTDNVDCIVGLSGEIKGQVEFYSEDINNKIVIDEAFAQNIYELEIVNKTQKEFTKLINAYNHNLLN